MEVFWTMPSLIVESQLCKKCADCMVGLHIIPILIGERDWPVGGASSKVEDPSLKRLPAVPAPLKQGFLKCHD